MRYDLSKQAREDLLARISSHEIIAAFNLLVAGMVELGVFEFKPNINGKKKAVHFKSGRVSYFAFIANREWLLWYFRRPGVRDGIFSFDELKSWFPKMEFSERSDPEKTEGILRIGSLQDAEAVMNFVRSKFGQR